MMPKLAHGSFDLFEDLKLIVKVSEIFVEILKEVEWQQVNFDNEIDYKNFEPEYAENLAFVGCFRCERCKRYLGEILDKYVVKWLRYWTRFRWSTALNMGINHEWS